MKILLDTNIIIHREAGKVNHPDIGYLFQWLDRLRSTKCVHPVTVEELGRNIDPTTVRSMSIKLGNYHVLKTLAPFGTEISSISKKVDINENDINDSKILNEVYAGRVDILISEDKKIHRKAYLLGIEDRVYKIDAFLEKVSAEHPELVDYKVLAVRKHYFGNVDINDPFFDSFREDYLHPSFNDWFNKKSDEVCYVCYQDKSISAFLFIKLEDENESYHDITPTFSRKRRLKVGTFKVTSNGYKLGERFLKIIFDNAYKQKVAEIYVTIFAKRPEQERLISLLQEWGFTDYGIKVTANGEEKVLVRDFTRGEINLENPKLTYPYISRESDVYIVPIYPEYHTNLLPDSYLKTESPNDFIENEPYRNALSKVYISRSHFRDLKSGDRIVFYRTGTGTGGPAKYTGVATTIGVVESVVTDIEDANAFVRLCRKRSVFSDEDLREHWNYSKKEKPFIVNFLFVFSFPRRPTLKWLNENGVIPDIKDMPRGFRKISEENFANIVNYSIGK